MQAGAVVEFNGDDAEKSIALSGFGPAMPTGRWTLGRLARIMLRPDLSAEEAILKFELTPFVSLTHGQLLQVQFEAGPVHEFRFPPTEMTQITIALPVACSNAGTVQEIRLALPQATSARSLGLADDDGLLGVEIQSMSLLRPSVLANGERIEFSRADLEETIVLSGFSAAEPTGRWSIGPESMIMFRAGAWAEKGAVLEIELTPFVDAGNGQTLRVHCAGQPEREFNFAPGKAVATVIAVPLAAAKAGAIQSIAWSLPKVVSPKTLGVGDDPRLLGVHVHAIRVVPRPTGPLAWLLQQGAALFAPRRHRTKSSPP